MLKQKLAEEPAQVAPVAPKPVKQPEQPKGGEQNKGKGSNGRSKDNSKRSSHADADGMWVKETLPALSDK